MWRFLVGLTKIGLVIGFVLAFAAIAATVVVVRDYGAELPDHEGLANYAPPLTTRVHAGDGRVMAEFKREHRLFVPIDEIPPLVRNAFLSAEDKGFYDHPGLDLQALIRAFVRNIEGLSEGRRLVGGSTITQQVAKNFLLTNEVSYERKIKEAILSFRIERALSKDKILELYLNEIYLGEGAYGVAAAAMTYYGKALSDLRPEEAAYLAALPKAPSNYHPVRQASAATARRNWVLGRMEEDGALPASLVETSRAMPLQMTGAPDEERYGARWFAEEIRRELAERYGEDTLYGGGMSVRATIDPALQDLAEAALKAGLEAYDKRHGYRGPLANFAAVEDWQALIDSQPVPDNIGDRQIAIVLETTAKTAEIGLAGGETGVIPYSEVRWARPNLDDQKVGARPNQVSKALTVGDVIVVSKPKDEATGEVDPDGPYRLDQIPDIQGAIVVLDPHTGRVLAMSGGYSAASSQFNRATQARRQPGSSIKPFIYLAALEQGYTPATLVLDAPFVIDIPNQGKWKPANYSGKIYGPSPMRLGLVKSRNLMTVRLAQHIGMGKVVETVRRFGIGDKMQPHLAMALGAGEVSLLDMTTAYGMLANGGKAIRASFIDSVQDRTGAVIFRHDNRYCDGCRGAIANPAQPPELDDVRDIVADPLARYQIVSMMQGVVENGTGRRVYMKGRPLAGKTGTTNDSYDAWFVGFSSNLAVGVYVGFDQPRTLGSKEGGSSAAAPIFRLFMEPAWKLRPGGPFKAPPGLEFSHVSATTGLPPARGEKNVVLEAFVPGTRPTTRGFVIGAGMSGDAPAAPQTATSDDNAAPAQPVVRERPRRSLGRVY